MREVEEQLEICAYDVYLDAEACDVNNAWRDR